MTKLVQKLLLIALLGVTPVVALAQKDRDKRPPKEPVKVITNDRKDQRPPPKDNQPRPKPGNRNRP